MSTDDIIKEILSLSYTVHIRNEIINGNHCLLLQARRSVTDSYERIELPNNLHQGLGFLLNMIRGS